MLMATSGTSFYKIYFYFIYVDVSVLSICHIHTDNPQRPEEGIRFTPCLSYIQAVVSHETSVWEQYSGPLEE